MLRNGSRLVNAWARSTLGSALLVLAMPACIPSDTSPTYGLDHEALTGATAVAGAAAAKESSADWDAAQVSRDMADAGMSVIQCIVDDCVDAPAEYVALHDGQSLLIDVHTVRALHEVGADPSGDSEVLVELSIRRAGEDAASTTTGMAICWLNEDGTRETTLSWLDPPLQLTQADDAEIAEAMTDVASVGDEALGANSVSHDADAAGFTDDSPGTDDAECRARALAWKTAKAAEIDKFAAQRKQSALTFHDSEVARLTRRYVIVVAACRLLGPAGRSCKAAASATFLGVLGIEKLRYNNEGKKIAAAQQADHDRITQQYLGWLRGCGE